MVTVVQHHPAAQFGADDVLQLAEALNQPAPLTPAHVSPADLAIACKREALLSLPYDALAVVMAENLGEPLPVKSPFAQAVARLGNDLSGTGGDTLATATTGSWLTRWQRLIPRKG